MAVQKKATQKQRQQWERQWNNRLPAARQLRDEQIVLKIGQETFTRRHIRDGMKYDCWRAITLLHQLIQERYPRIKNVYELSRTVTVPELMRLKGAGQEVATAYAKILMSKGIDPNQMIDHRAKLAAIYATAKRPEKEKGPTVSSGRTGIHRVA